MNWLFKFYYIVFWGQLMTFAWFLYSKTSKWISKRLFSTLVLSLAQKTLGFCLELNIVSHFGSGWFVWRLISPYWTKFFGNAYGLQKQNTKTRFHSTDIQVSEQGLFPEGKDWFPSFSNRKTHLSVVYWSHLKPVSMRNSP